VAASARGEALSLGDRFGECGVDLAGLLAAVGQRWDRARALSSLLGSGPSRDIVVVHGPVGEEAAAIATAWAVETAAAILLEPDVPRWPQTLAWARPTVVVAAGSDLEHLAEALRRVERKPERLRRRLGPLGRVRAVVGIGPAASDGDSWWSGIGLPVSYPDLS
jgi:hypothetical protein